MTTLFDIYKSYGGFKAFVLSPYLWLSLFFTGIFFAGINQNEDWFSLPIKTIPPLTGFTFASFSLLFAIIDEDNRLILSQPDTDFGGRKPILIVVSKIVHSVMMQLCALVAALLLHTKPIVLNVSQETIDMINSVATGFALFLFIYGLLLVVSVALTLFQLVDIVADAADVTELGKTEKDP